MPDLLRIPFNQMEHEFLRILVNSGFEKKKAEQCAHIFAVNSLEGVYSHGVNRFARFIQSVKDGHIKPDAEPEKKHSSGALEQWDGGFGPGPLNAVFCTERAIELSAEYGIGCAAIGRTNHWMRAGYYGWKAAKAGFALIAWTNTNANMPPWGAMDCRLGNNPIVLALPYKNEAIVLDAAMSQFAYGTLDVYRLAGRELPLPGGYDEHGNLTTDPTAILSTQRILPMGYWKGSGMALLLDLLATILSGGLSTKEITDRGSEHGLSQVFIAADLSSLGNQHAIPTMINNIIEDYRTATPMSENTDVLYPGERIVRSRKDNAESGIPVDQSVWNEILGL
jgi:3-dehydro-L-gulonate 2-dehydrogenase